MKKRFKLITTIASLCLAVALMAFGVYAAQLDTATISGQVNFNATVGAGSWAETFDVEITEGGTFDGKTGGEATKVTGVTAIPAISTTTAAATIVLEVTATFTNAADMAVTLSGTASKVSGGATGTTVTGSGSGNVAKGNGQTGTCVVEVTIQLAEDTKFDAVINYKVDFNAEG